MKRVKKFGVEALAKSMGLKEGTVRIKLRKAKVRRTGRAYKWGSSSEVNALARKIA